MQEAVLLESRALASVNVLQWVWHVPVTIDLAAFTKALQQVIRDHKVLASQFVFEGDVFYQDFDQLLPPEVNVQKVTELAGFEFTLGQYLSQDRHRGFTLNGQPFFRCHVFTLPQKTVCVFTAHGACLDNQGFALFLKSLLAELQGSDATLGMSFYDFLSLEHTSKTLDHGYWCKLLADCPESPLPVLPLAVSDEALSSHSSQARKELPEELKRRITNVSSELEVSVETIIESAWALLLHRYCSTDSLLFGASGQFRKVLGPSYADTLGSFFNTLPVRVELDHSKTVLELLRELEAQRSQRLKSPHIPLLEVLKHGGGQAKHLSTAVHVDYLDWGSVVAGFDSPWCDSLIEARYQSSFDLACNLRFGSKAELVLDYKVEKFDCAGASQLLRHLENLVKNLLSNINASVFDVEMLDSTDISVLKANSTSNERSHEFTPVQDAIYQIAAKTPSARAVQEGEQQLSYDELIARVDTLTGILIEAGVDQSTIVAIAIPRSIEFVVAVIAVLRAGAAYLPVDIKDPIKRLKKIARDSNASTLLVIEDKQDLQRLLKLKVIETSPHALSERKSERRPALPSCKPTDAAYIIYTSGTTGAPKGVLIEHRSLSNHCFAMMDQLKIDPSDVVLQFASTVFDVHVEEIFTTLCSGANLVIRNEESSQSARRFFELVDRFSISVLNLPSAFWAALVEQVGLGNVKWPATLKTLIVGGEKVGSATFLEYRKQDVKNVQFINGYGPTETTITSTIYKVPKSFSSISRETDKLCRGTLPIGAPISGLKHFVLDHHQRLSAPGATGYLYIGGAGVARAYINKPKLTKEKFVVLPHIDASGDRYYSTGDKVYSDGEDLFYIGRTDNQIKVRGYRIELSEIESAINSISSVTNSIVEVDPQSPGVLVAFLESGKSIELTELQQRLLDKLPSYMIPGICSVHDRFPLTRAGKVDRKSLWSEYHQKATLDEDGYSLPLTKLQTELMRIWKDVLGDIQLGVKDSFFQLGGHSLLAVKLFAKIEEEYNVLVPLREFFQSPTIETLEQLINSDTQNAESQQPEEVAFGNIHPLQTDGEGCPVYFICGIDLYQELANELGTTQPAFGIFLPIEERMFRAFKQSDGEFALPSTEQMASDYVQAIRQNQPFGPYKLAGISFGGILAYEIAQQLLADGETVETLLLIDSFVPHKRRVLSFQYIKHRWERLKTHRFGQVRGAVAKLMEAYKKRKNRKLIATKISQANDTDFALFRHVVYRQSALKYGPTMRPYPGKIILIRALDGGVEAEGVNNPDHGWGKYAQGGVQCVDVPGDHVGVLKQPNVKVLAQQVLPSILATEYQSGWQGAEFK